MVCISTWLKQPQIILRSCKTTYMLILLLLASIHSPFHLKCSKQVLPISLLLECLLTPSSFFYPSSRARIDPQPRLLPLTLALLQPLIGHGFPPCLWPLRRSSTHSLYTSIVRVQCSVNVCKALVASAGWCWSRPKGLTRFDNRQSWLFF